MRWFLHGKIHKPTVTQANLNYVGSITIDENLCNRLVFKKVKKFWSLAIQAVQDLKLMLFR